MISKEVAGTNRANKIALLRADNARLHSLAVELETDVRELRTAVGMRQSRPAVDPVHRLLVVSGGERRARA